MPEVDVSIIVPAYNEDSIISDCLSSLLALDYPKDKYEIIVVNDGSTDKTADVVNVFAKTYQNFLSLSKENGGKASAQNLGVKHANGRFILITDADAIVEKKWILKMLNDLEIYDVVLGSYYAKDTDTWLEKIQNALHLIKSKFGGVKGKPTTGVNNGFKKEVLKKIGNFNESKTSITGDFIKRAEKAKFKVYFNPEIVVFTKCTKTIGGVLKQKLRWRENVLNYLKGEKITFLELLGIGYTDGLSLILFISILLSLFSLNYRYFLFFFFGIFSISFLLYAKAFLKMCKSKEKHYAKYFIVYLLLEMMVRMILIPYLIYRLIKPRRKPTFDTRRE